MGVKEDQGVRRPAQYLALSTCSVGSGEDGDAGDDDHWRPGWGRGHERLYPPSAGNPHKLCRVDKERVTSLVVHELGGAVLLAGDICPDPYALDFWGRGHWVTTGTSLSRSYLLKRVAGVSFL